ncbi:AlpA family transcriptional regulator [uncultured Brevundimonas sp.]|uniref:helix-turn-helix transcriptional regulator n=1 Tax=uncultured Brevundimonas sp. TaxID=213418 RepID=UPI0025DA038F|nr:AlpA family phage regulatory protein [uncultured Brevundimonas sp.]
MGHDDGLERFLGWRQVRHLTGLGRTTAWRLRQAGDFPDPVPISPGRVAWREGDIARWNASREAAPEPAPAALPIRPTSPRPRKDGILAAPTAKPDRSKSPIERKGQTRLRRRAAPVIAEGQLGFDF